MDRSSKHDRSPDIIKQQAGRGMWNRDRLAEPHSSQQLEIPYIRICVLLATSTELIHAICSNNIDGRVTLLAVLS